MSMFDNVKGEFKCTQCGHVNTNFQTKEHSCVMAELDFRMCDYFYTSCECCGGWMQVIINEAAVKKLMELRKSLTAEDYDIDVETKDEREERFGKIKKAWDEKTNDASKNKKEVE